MKILRSVMTLALFALPVLSVTIADDGYRLDYDYPNQGDDWYGGSEAPDSRRDYEPLDVDQAYNGDDYGVGYERLFDPFGFGPPLELFVDRYSAYEFRFGNLAFYGYECWQDDDCGSGSWCVGQPTCDFNHCQPGKTRDCSDGDDCTDDTCDSSLEQCLHDWVQPPGEASGLILSKGPGSTIATLTWDDQVDEEWYNVYRGENPWLDDLACYEPDIVGTSVDDDGTVAPSGLYVHLVTADHHCGEGHLGFGSDGLRLNTNPCP